MQTESMAGRTEFVTDISADFNESASATETEWLKRFYAGDREILAACYRDHYAVVEMTVARYLRGADRETVIHDLFFTLLSEEGARRNFVGGSFSAWVRTLARNRAIDFVRVRQREQHLDPELAQGLMGEQARYDENKREAQQTVDEFREKILPKKWAAVFEARFLEQLSQREAAERLGISRTTLAYQEHRVRVLLKKFLLQAEK